MTDDAPRIPRVPEVLSLLEQIEKQQQQLLDLEARQRVQRGMLLGLCRRWRQEGPKHPRNGPMCADELEEIVR